jgi:hypothetical protein
MIVPSAEITFALASFFDETGTAVGVDVAKPGNA